jgi:multicomponent Na+:H+ antiporter subunit D
MIAAGVSAGAILRSGARVFLGWGPPRDDLLTQQDEENPPTSEKVRPLLIGVTAVMLALGLAVSLVPGIGRRAEYGAERFRNHAAYAQRVLHGKPMKQTPQLAFVVEPTTTESVLYGIGAFVIAFGAAAFGLWRQRLPGLARDAVGRVVMPPVQVLRAAHSGIIGDYVMWVVVGTALIGGAWALTLR